MDMQSFLIRLFIGLGIIWLVDIALAKFGTNPDAKKAIEIIVLIVAIIFILFGGYIINVR